MNTPRSKSSKNSADKPSNLQLLPSYDSKLNLHNLVTDGKQRSSQKMRGFSEDIRQLDRKRSLTHLPISADEELRASPCEQGPSRSYFEGLSGIRSTRQNDEVDIVQ